MSSNALVIAAMNSWVPVCGQECLDSTPNLSLSGAGMSITFPKHQQGAYHIYMQHTHNLSHNHHDMKH